MSNAKVLYEYAKRSSEGVNFGLTGVLRGGDVTSTGSDPEGDALAQAHESARLLLARAAEVKQISPSGFRLLKDFVFSGFNQIGGQTQTLRSAVGDFGSVEPSVSADSTKNTTNEKELHWNKPRKSLALEWLILKRLSDSHSGAATVDDILDFVTRAFPRRKDEPAENYRAKLISKISREKAKGYIDDIEGQKGLGYKLSTEGRLYIDKLTSKYLNSSELSFLSSKVGQ